MRQTNWLWGAPRIHGELLKLGIEVAESTVAKYMVKQRAPHGLQVVVGTCLTPGVGGPRLNAVWGHVDVA
jgi:hypothetical protein